MWLSSTQHASQQGCMHHNSWDPQLMAESFKSSVMFQLLIPSELSVLQHWLIYGPDEKIMGPWLTAWMGGGTSIGGRLICPYCFAATPHNFLPNSQRVRKGNQEGTGCSKLEFIPDLSAQSHIVTGVLYGVVNWVRSSVWLSHSIFNLPDVMACSKLEHVSTSCSSAAQPG